MGENHHETPRRRSSSSSRSSKEHASQRRRSSTDPRASAQRTSSQRSSKTEYVTRSASTSQSGANRSSVPNNKGTQKNKRKKPLPKPLQVTKSIFGGIGKTILALFLVFVIVGCIAATALTVFVMRYVESESAYDLHNIEQTLTSRIYAINENGENEVVRTMTGSGRRDWIDISAIPQHVQDAVVCAEDARFMEHEGVDWLRTFGAFANLATGGKLNFKGGASTITQQVIKNINGDFAADTRTPTTKLREILAALNVEKHFTKPEILSAYINLFSLGKNNYGIQAGAQYYFGKDVSELSIVEAASLACITKSPENNNPIANQEKNKIRRDYVLENMLENEKITQAEFDEAIAVQEIPVVDYTPKEGEEEAEKFSWYDDAVIRQVKLDLMEKYDYDEATAIAKITGGGLQIYSAQDKVLQGKLETEFANPKNFNYRDVEGRPDTAMVIMDYSGYVVAMMPSRDEKEGVAGGSTITTGTVMMGSSMKPIVAYAPALEENRIAWNTIVKDEAYVKEPSSKNPMQSNGKNWPRNWNSKYDGDIEIHKALYLSKNTIPVKLLLDKGLNETLQWLENSLGLSTLDYGNEGPAITLGSMSRGVHLDEFTAAYTMFGNNGVHQSHKYYSKVLDASGKAILEADTEGKQVIGSDTAYIMNRMMREVISVRGATGTVASLDNMGIEVVGKTGTTESTALSFVGLTPYHVSSLWIGNPTKASQDIKGGSTYQPTNIWKNIMSKIYQGYEAKDFSYLDSSGVVQRDGGYYKSSVAAP